MKKLLPCCVLLLTPVLSAHGGQYRGPSNVVPPSNTGSGATPSTKTNTGATSPGPGTAAGAGSSTGSSPGVVTPGGVTPGIAGGLPRGVPLGDDLTRWEFWWEFGKDPYLRLREAVYSERIATGSDDTFLNPVLRGRAKDIARPTDADLDRVADRLASTLQSATDRDTSSACLIALAKLGRVRPDWNLRDLFTPFLRSHDQELRETAALALGIAGATAPETLDLMIDLVRDTDAARRVSQQATINERTRSFSAFGLGLLLARTEQPAAAHRIVGALIEVLQRHDTNSRDLTVAAIEALAQLPRKRGGAAFDALRQGIVTALGAFYDQPLGPGDQLLQAHVPPAIARLASGATADTWRRRFAADLLDSMQRTTRTGAKTNVHIAQSCALALGDLNEPWQDDNSPAKADGELLLRAYHNHRDQQTRSFAMLALARIGGEQAQRALLAEFAVGNRAFEQPWCGVALGVLAERSGRGAAKGEEPDPVLVQPLRAAFKEAKNGGTIAALAIALALCGDKQSGDALRAALAEHGHRDEVAGYLCIALGLMRDDRAMGPIRNLLDNSERRPTVMLQCARALGMLGDGAVLDALCRRLQDPEPSLVRLSAVAAALGQIGDRRSIDPLLTMLADERLTPLTRAFAAVALGGVCDKDPLPWNWSYASHTNYRAATATLTDGAAGILDIL
ncbi:MAG: HEAT repeat domain-containing protein [Planctomycetes bacterium]|nr:HEAT repeat domain-containing protein [Planctomycetota bacterium]MCB9887209.1 HEAT repeat domain-containing protein [Planctomycetota bacterium]